MGAINPGEVLSTAAFAGGAVTAGNFYVNGIAITVDPTQDSLSDVISRINDSDAQVTASYDGTTDSIRVVSKALGSRTIAFTSGSAIAAFMHSKIPPRTAALSALTGGLFTVTTAMTS